MGQPDRESQEWIDAIRCWKTELCRSVIGECWITLYFVPDHLRLWILDTSRRLRRTWFGSEARRVTYESQKGPIRMLSMNIALEVDHDLDSMLGRVTIYSILIGFMAEKEEIFRVREVQLRQKHTPHLSHNNLLSIVSVWMTPTTRMAAVSVLVLRSTWLP